MGLEFGNLPVRIRRVLYYSLSYMEQKAWVNSVSHGIPNLISRSLHALPPILPAIISMFIVVKWSEAAHRRYIRKDPKLYENDA